jgi:hypothetical protein
MKWRKTGSLRNLVFDIENRPLSYQGEGYTNAEVTAIAASFTDEAHVHVWMLGEVDQETMLSGFKGLYDEAGIVTGHYMRMHDLPMINGSLIEVGLPILSPKLTCDTYLDLVKRKELPSGQGELAEMFGLPEEKVIMSQTKWRRGNRLRHMGVQQVRERVVGDVVQCKALRAELISRGLLKAPRVWSP